MSNMRRAGRITLKVDGNVHDAKGSFSYSLNPVKRASVVGHDRVHGFNELPQAVFIEGVITDASELALVDLYKIENATVTLDLNNGKTVVLYRAWYVSEGKVTTEQGEIEVRFEAAEGKELK